MTQELQFELAAIDLINTHMEQATARAAVLKKKQDEIDVEQFFGSEQLLDSGYRENAWKAAGEFKNLLDLEHSIYVANIENILSEIKLLTDEITVTERDAYYERLMPRFKSGVELSISINRKGVEVIECFEKILNFWDDADGSAVYENSVLIFQDQETLDRYDKLEDELANASDAQRVLFMERMARNQQSDQKISSFKDMFFSSVKH